MTRLSTLVSALLSPLPPPLCGFWGGLGKRINFWGAGGVGAKTHLVVATSVQPSWWLLL